VQEEVEAYGGNNGALAAVDPANGQILTLVGSRDYYDEQIDGEVNIMTSLHPPLRKGIIRKHGFLIFRPILEIIRRRTLTVSIADR